MTRSTNGALLGGVCAGLAVRLGVREQLVRIIVSLSVLFFGVGLVIYMAAWLFVPRWGEDRSVAQRLVGARRESHIILLTLLVALVALLALGNFARRGTGAVSWPLLLGIVAVVAVWFGSSRDEKRHLEGIMNATPILGSSSARGWRALAWRLVPGIILLVIGLETLRRIGGVWGGAVPAILGAGALALGAAILLAPWWLDNVRDLSRERRERVRIEERAKLVAHVHDSVLQTLTLIEKAANSPTDVIRLARAQERELREWLFAPQHFAERDDAHGTLAQQLRQIESDVEGDYGVTVELVVVGDCPGDAHIAALTAATREAAINAAKWAQVSRVSIYGEVEPTAVSVFVRDTGIGFDLAQVADDRHGINHSIVERMTSHGGEAVIHSVRGEGTEVRLSMTRVAAPA
jgi:signal transduction histidine kinase